MNFAKVSVVIPVYNVELYLEECLDSILTQTLREIEVICVNDGSTDGSLEILKCYAAKDSRLQIIDIANGGAGAARNLGFKSAQGEYVIFFDSDDYMRNNALQLLYDQAVATSSDITLGRSKALNQDSGKLTHLNYSIKTNMLSGQRLIRPERHSRYILQAFVGWPWDKLYRREFLVESGLEYPCLHNSEDTYFVLMSLIEASLISYVDDEIFVHRFHSTSLEQSRVKSPLCFYEALMILHAALVAKGVYDLYEQSFVNYCIEFSRWYIDSINDDGVKPQMIESIYTMIGKLDIKDYPKSYFYDESLYAFVNEYITRYKTLEINSNDPCSGVSIIIPTYNASKYLRECLNSVVNQTLHEIEIICVNDGSTDDSLEIIEEYAKKDSRIKIISKANSGYGHTMNVGIEAATKEYVGIVEPDDFIALNMYKDLYLKAKQLDLDVIKSDFNIFVGEGNDRFITRATLDVTREYYDRIIEPRRVLIAYRFVMNTWSGIYKRDFLIANNIRHNESPGASFQDNGFWFLTLSYAKRFYITDIQSYFYRQDNEMSSVKNADKVFCLCDEHKYIRNIIDNDNSLKHLIGAFTHKKYCNYYIFNLNRISFKFKWDFLLVFHEEFKQSNDNGELDWSLFYPEESFILKKIIENPRQIYRKIVKNAILDWLVSRKHKPFSNRDIITFFGFKFNVKRPGNYLNSHSVKLFHLLPIATMRNYIGKQWFFLLGIIPFYKIKDKGNNAKHYLFGFIPVLKVKIKR